MADYYSSTEGALEQGQSHDSGRNRSENGGQCSGRRSAEEKAQIRGGGNRFAEAAGLFDAVPSKCFPENFPANLALACLALHQTDLQLLQICTSDVAASRALACTDDCRMQI